nr:MAG TPA: hypothetical protein [Caudoviricetes sp.]
MIKNNKESIDIELNLEVEETIKKLEKIKQLLQDIIELDETINDKEYKYYRHKDGSISTCPEIEINIK